jgi:hypothetical protein
MHRASLDWVSLLAVFAPLFAKRAGRYIPVLITGAILAPGKRTITSALCIMGLENECHFQNSQRRVWPQHTSSRSSVRDRRVVSHRYAA